MAKKEAVDSEGTLIVPEGKVITCPGCGVKLDVTKVEEGTTIQCPKCDVSFPVSLEEKRTAKASPVKREITADSLTQASNGVKETDLEAIRDLAGKRDILLEAIGKVIVGQLISVFSRGHCLVVGVPGLAKTLLVKTIAKLLALNFKRIQFTPDMMPSDITGTDIIEEDSSPRGREHSNLSEVLFLLTSSWLMK